MLQCFSVEMSEFQSLYIWYSAAIVSSAFEGRVLLIGQVSNLFIFTSTQLQL